MMKSVIKCHLLDNLIQRFKTLQRTPAQQTLAKEARKTVVQACPQRREVREE